MTTHSRYSIFPGRQHYVVIVPPKYQHLFFEGVQSMDATPNVEELNHGQYGFQSDVITERDFKNVSGTIACKDLGYMQRVLRSMCGQNPDTSFMFDPARLGVVDVFENIYNKARSRVEGAKWWIDLNPSTKYSSNLDDVETWDFDYTSKRLVTFEGYQIVCQTFADTLENQNQFLMTAPALIDPVMENVTMNSSTGVISGQVRHEMCPVQYALRVWVDGVIIQDPRDASIVTVSVPSALGGTIKQSTLHLRNPLSKAGQIVKVMWLADGASMISSTGVTQAPVMIRSIPVMDNSATPAVWANKLTVVFNKSIESAALAALAGTDFSLTWTTTGDAYSWQPTTLDIAKSITDNAIELEFEGNPMVSTAGAPPVEATGLTWPTATPAILSYAGVTLKGADGFVSPYHVVSMTGY